MAVQLFDNREIGVLSAAGPSVVTVTFSLVPGAVAFVNGVSYEYSRSVAHIPNMLSPHVITVSGFPQGKLTLLTLVTLRDNLERIIRAYSNLCGGGSITIAAYDPCTGKIASVSCMNCVLAAIGGKLSVTEPVISCGLSFIFTHLIFNNV